MKTTLVVAFNVRQFDDYMRVLSDTVESFDRQHYRYVFGLSDLAGRRPDQTECILLGRYYEKPDWREMRAHLEIRRINCTEVYDWR